MLGKFPTLNGVRDTAGAVDSYGGLPIVISWDYPKRQLSEDCPVTPEFRAEINLWMLGFFGVTNLVPDGQVTNVQGVLYMNPRTYKEFKKAVNELSAYDLLRGA